MATGLETHPAAPRPLFAASLLVLVMFASCNRAAPLDDPAVLEQALLTTPDELERQLDEVLTQTSERRLNLEDHAAWQILHGVLAYQREFLVQREPDGELVRAVHHLLEGGSLRGWTVEPGLVRDEGSNRRGLRALLEAGSKSGQGHPDQWFAVLAQCGLEPSQRIVADDHIYTMADFVAQVQSDLPRNLDREFSWTLIGLTSYLPTDASWTAVDGESWSIERLVEIELDQDLGSSACGGTHRLIGLSMALNQHLAQGRPLDGAWSLADMRIQAAIENARRYQNLDGSFSSHYFARGGSSPDLAQDLGTTGHVLEFLTLATTDEQLREPWITRSVIHLCELFRRTRDLPLECGALYHAAHGLVLYRQRVFGLDTSNSPKFDPT